MLRRSHLLLLAVLLALLPATSVHALTLTQVDQSSPWPGIVITQYRTSDPAADVWVAEIDLCADYVRVEATEAPSGYQTASAWGSSQGLQLATNGDFYRPGPQVYGEAVGGALRWPLDQTGLDPAYAASAGIVVDTVGGTDVEIYRLRIARAGVPEPATFALLLLALTGLAVLRGRRRPQGAAL